MAYKHHKKDGYITYKYYLLTTKKPDTKQTYAEYSEEYKEFYPLQKDGMKKQYVDVCYPLRFINN